jgi:hypothetical protein
MFKLICSFYENNYYPSPPWFLAEQDLIKNPCRGSFVLVLSEEKIFKFQPIRNKYIHGGYVGFFFKSR